MKRSTVIWLASIALTLAFLVWQRISGPTHGIRFAETVAGARADGKLVRSGSINHDLPVEVHAPDPALAATVVWRRYPTGEAWTELALARDGDLLRAALPRQMMAGKLEYHVRLMKDGQSVQVPRREAAVARYKGDVPPALLASHIACMIVGMFFSTACGMNALLRGGSSSARLSQLAFGFLLAGGCILGPIVQKYAFDAYWTGWPLGSDWTDNKLAIGALAWLVAAWRCRGARAGDPGGRWWAVAAMLVVLVIYGIPHSIHGSTLDYATGEHIQAWLAGKWPTIG